MNDSDNAKFLFLLETLTNEVKALREKNEVLENKLLQLSEDKTSPKSLSNYSGTGLSNTDVLDKGKILSQADLMNEVRVSDETKANMDLAVNKIFEFCEKERPDLTPNKNWRQRK